MKSQQMQGQISLFDLVPAKAAPNPTFHARQTVFVRSVDMILPAVIERSFLIDRDAGQYYGYHLAYVGGGRTVLWDHSIGDKLFSSAEYAREVAEKVKPEKISPDSLSLTDIVSYRYIRQLDGHGLTATLAKSGDKKLYEHEFMCYHFLRKYPNQKSRDKAYVDLLKKITQESDDYSAVSLNPPALETLYKVNDKLYASREYAEWQSEF